jgi:hypothetical protein
MRCPSCGWPLSPAHTTANCPRCGTPIDSGQQAGQVWLQGPVSQPGFFSTGTPPPLEPKSPRYSRNMKLGFTVAGLCVLIGGLILIFVYFIAIGLPGGSSNNTTNSTSHGSTLTTAPTSTVALSPAATATVYPGQQYIDNAQMASAIDTTTKQPTQLTTTFKTNQNIYVAFQLHPPGHGGAVCLLWYLNGKLVTPFSFAASAYSKLSYAYAIYGEAGAGYVEIYWASTKQCTDQLLAQHVDFTVTT